MQNGLPVNEENPEQAGQLARLVSLLGEHAPEGHTVTEIPRISMLRASERAVPAKRITGPIFYIVAQGTKRIAFGNRQEEMKAGDFILSNPDLHINSQVVTASAAKPYLGVSLDIDLSLVAELLAQIDHAPGGFDPATTDQFRIARSHRGIANTAMLDALCRMVELIGRPGEVAALAPLYEREIIFRILRSGAGVVLFHLASNGGRYNELIDALEWIRAHYVETFALTELARDIGTSESILRRAFRQSMSTTPHQFQKRLRLQEARRRLIIGAEDAASVGAAVGYRSVSQFSRDYKRQFGQSPARDARSWHIRSQADD